ncbi:caspase domain-domain-containing protein [Catenaria anguillulae PL171]|uniref:Caspase domain-domain-containing protein n=1 Tax=Catenaria anguillulae PL171 TaxID=765915 RepID=A0A1Y2HSJ9_9FUNG|nr:caspase domain-domain-containing protein [Catenaria anguillulae PL171]
MSAQAVCIGLGYNTNANADDDLPGTIQDAQTMATVATNNGFEASTLTDVDEPVNREQILDSLRSMVENAQPGDNLCFMFSGHGGNASSGDPNEVDGVDEFIVDSYGNPIYDNEIRDILTGLPAGANMTMAFDNCRSGTIADLDTAGIEGNVVCISASLDNENSLAGENGSLFTNALAEVMAEHPDASWQEIKDMIDARVGDLGQTVQLSSTDPALLDEPPFGVSPDPEKLMPLMLQDQATCPDDGDARHDKDIQEEDTQVDQVDLIQELDQVIQDPFFQDVLDTATTVANVDDTVGGLINDTIASGLDPNAEPSALEIAWNEAVGNRGQLDLSSAVMPEDCAGECDGCNDGLMIM